MMRRLFCFSFMLLLCIAVNSINVHRSQSLKKWGIEKANYSGITCFRPNFYAVVSDKENELGFHIWEIIQDSVTGSINDVHSHGFRGQKSDDKISQQSLSLDSEDLFYCIQRNSFFVCNEADQSIIELDTTGNRTSYELQVPDYLRLIYPNYGFEAMAYDSVQKTIYITTENTLPADGNLSSLYNPSPSILHIQSYQGFTNNNILDFQLSNQYLYSLDATSVKKLGRQHIHGVVAMTSLGNNKLIILEREAYVSHSFVGSWVLNKLYLVDTGVDNNIVLPKQLLAQWKTHFDLFRQNWANFEGMCLGRTLIDGRQTLLLVSDSQGGYGKGPLHLKDYIRVIVL